MDVKRCSEVRRRVALVQYYDGIPVGICDFISDAKTVGTSTDCSTIYAVQLGEGALSGLTSPGDL